VHNKSIFKIGLIVLLSFFLQASLKAQEHEEKETHELLKHHRVSLVLSHTHIPRGLPTDTSFTSLILPSWGFNYEYWFNHKWAIGLHNDMEISAYVVEGKNGEEFARTRPIIISLVSIYKPWRGLEMVAGFGREIEKEHDFWVFRFGLEYEIEFGNQWDISPGLVLDIKENLYDSFTIGLGVGKRF
jgi:hypothetical protein